MIILLGILGATVLALVLDMVRLDIVALLCLLALAWTGLLTPQQALSGFSSNAVMAMVAVMIMSEGAARTGMMERVARWVAGMAQHDKRGLVGLSSLTVGVLSGLVQNVGAAALFLPALLDISRRERIAATELIMPVGFAAILGGTLTMIGSGPLIVSGDLLREAGLVPYGFLDVTPIGLALLLGGIAYFYLFGNRVLPRGATEGGPSPQKRLIDAWRLPFVLHHYVISDESRLHGKTPEDAGLWEEYRLNVLALSHDGDLSYAPWRGTTFAAGQDLVLLGVEEDMRRFAEAYQLEAREKLGEFRHLEDPARAGFAEVIIPPRSEIVGKSIREYALRKRWSVEPLIYFGDGVEVRGDFSDRRIEPGDLFVVHGLWQHIMAMRESADFVVVTSVEAEPRETSKAWLAALCFAGAVALALAGFAISLAFLSGAVAMVLLGVLDMDRAYQAIEWKVVFLVGGLIPLGIAMEGTGTAAFLGETVMAVLHGHHPAVVMLGIAVMATLFSLFMSNVASTIVLAPVVINMAEFGGLDPRPMVLLTAVCAANAFVLPTHQVNALLMTPGGYEVRDYVRAGTGMTVLFLLIVIAGFYLLYV